MIVLRDAPVGPYATTIVRCPRARIAVATAAGSVNRNSFERPPVTV